MGKNDISVYFNKYPSNLYFLLCSSSQLNKNQIFKILDAVKDNEELCKKIKHIIRENDNVNHIIEESLNVFYSDNEIKYYKFRKKLEDTSFYKNKEFIDTIDFDKYSSFMEYDTFFNWDFDYLMIKLNRKFLDALSINENFKWTTALIEKFKNKLTVYNWRALSTRSDIEWNLDILIKYQDYWKWDELSKNKSIPFSEEIIIHFKDKWNERYTYGNLWQYLLKNNSVQWSYKLLSFYLTEKEKNFKYLYDYDAFNLFYQNKGVLWSYEYLDLNGCIAPFLSIEIPWTNSIIEKYKDQINWTKFSDRNDVKWNEVIRKFTNFINWKILSKNENVNWTLYLIVEYENFIDFKELSSNPKVEWSRLLLNRYKEKLDWTKLALNTGIIWNSILLSEFKDYVSFYSLTRSQTFVWSTEILVLYKDRWDFDCDYFIGKRCNDCLFEKTFYTPEICNNNNVTFTIKFILEKLVLWENTWSKFVAETSRKTSPIYLNGQVFDKNNPIWERLSENKNLNSELIKYFIEFWDYKILLNNKNINWDFDLICYLDEKLDSNNSNYYIQNYWTSFHDNNYLNKFELEELHKYIM